MTSVFTGGRNRKPELENEVIRKLFAEPHKKANVPSSTRMLMHSWNPRIMESLKIKTYFMMWNGVERKFHSSLNRYMARFGWYSWNMKVYQMVNQETKYLSRSESHPIELAFQSSSSSL